MKINYQIITANTEPSGWLGIVQIKVKAQLGKLLELYNSDLFINTMYMK